GQLAGGLRGQSGRGLGRRARLYRVPRPGQRALVLRNWPTGRQLPGRRRQQSRDWGERRQRLLFWRQRGVENQLREARNHMSATTLRAPTKAPPLQKETTVGNYFVSNYPPYSFWKPEFTGELLAALERPPKPGTPLGIYVHIPFCRKRCHFCYFKVYTDKDSAAIRGYIDAVLREFKLYAGKPFVGGRKPNF